MNEQNRGEGLGLGLVCVCVRNKNLPLSCFLYSSFCVFGYSQVLARPSSVPRQVPTVCPTTVSYPIMPFSSTSIAAFLKATRCSLIQV